MLGTFLSGATKVRHYRYFCNFGWKKSELMVGSIAEKCYLCRALAKNDPKIIISKQK
jgi:hypothetical protein